MKPYDGSDSAAVVVVAWVVVVSVSAAMVVTDSVVAVGVSAAHEAARRDTHNMNVTRMGDRRRGDMQPECYRSRTDRNPVLDRLR